MNGGKMILAGLLILFVFLLLLTVWNGFHALWTLVLGGIPIALILLGVVFIMIGVTDLRAQQAEAKAASGDAAQDA